MAVTFPRDLILEAYLGRWVNITALPDDRRLRQVEPVKVTWGLPTEQTRALAPPSTVEGVLNNVGGHWTPGNPMSDYYDFLQGRNVPTRLALRIVRDTFARTVVGDWGFADTETSAWQTGGINAAFSVGSGSGSIVVSAVSSFGLATLADSYPDCQIAATCTVNVNNITGGSIEPCNLVLRYQPSGAFAGEHYLLRAECTSAEVLNLTIHHNSLGALSSTVVVPGLIDAVSAKTLRAKFQMEGQTLRGKVYKPGPANDPDQFEPLDWQVTAHDERLSGGFPGYRCGVAAGNTNIPVTFLTDDLEVRLMGHTGELAKLQPDWDESHRIKRAAIRCAGITQRLGRPRRPALSSAPRRYMASNAEFTATDFWPLDEAATDTIQGVNAVAGGAPTTFQREFDGADFRGAVLWGQTDEVLTSVPGFVELNNGGQLTLATRTASLGSVWSVSWATRLSSDGGARVFFHTSTTSHFVFTFYTDGTWELFRNPGSVSLMTGVFPLPAGLDGQWLTMGLSVYNNGGGTNVGMRITANGEDIGGSSWSGAAAYSALQSVVLYVPQPNVGGQGGGAFSSLVVTNRRLDDVLVFTATEFLTVGMKIANVTKGWIGERALARGFRLCAEEGVPFDYFGSFGDTRPMGSQRPIPLLDQLVECAEANGDFLYEPRYTPGIAMRPRRSMVARAPVATLSYSSGHVAPPFAPAADDRPTANLVRAEMSNGEFLIVEQTTGPMNTKDPGKDPESIGKSPADAKGNVEAGAHLGDLGGWVRALGTVPEMRFPKVTVNLAARELTTGVDPTLPARQVLQLRVGDRLLVQGLQAADIYRDLDQLVRGGVEVFTNVRQHRVTLNTAPYEKYKAGVYGDTASRYDGAVTTVDAQLAAGVTGARNVATTAGPVWTTAAGAFPLDVVIGGERMTLSGITGTGAAQVMTISARNLNGLPAAGGKTHPAGTRVYLYQRCYYA